MKKSLLILCLLFFYACKKNEEKQTETRYCWQIIDYAGNELTTICNKTEEELKACVNSGSCGNFNGGASLSPCNYYKIEGDKSCWMIGNIFFSDITGNAAKLYANCFFGGAVPVKVACNYCSYWFHREKRTYKPTNSFTYSAVTRERFCGDTVATLFRGREIIRKDDADSLISIQFSDDGTW